MDDEIIHSWCFHDVECFDSTPSTAIIILEEDLESFSSLRSHHGHRLGPLRLSLWSGGTEGLSSGLTKVLGVTDVGDAGIARTGRRRILGRTRASSGGQVVVVT